MFSCTQSLAPRSLMGVCKDELRKNGVKIPTDAEAVPVRKEREYRKVPMKRLVARLGLKKYDVPAPITDCPEVKEVKILFSQHIGVPSKACVEVGDKVKIGDMIAQAAEKGLGVNIHSSIDGTVADITQKYIKIVK